jgi:hypothetical protein
MFNNFWNLEISTFKMHIYFLVLRQQGLSRYIRSIRSISESSRKSSTFSNHVKVEGSDIKTCKEEFMSCHLTVMKSQDFV